MRIKIQKLVVLIFCLISAVGFSQKQDKMLAEANAKFDEFSFVKARKIYEKLVGKGYKSNEVYERLGDSYFFNSDYKNALKWYELMMGDEGAYFLPEYYHRYWVCLRANDEYEHAMTVMSKYYEKSGDHEQAKKWDPKEYLTAIAEQSGRYNGLTDAGAHTAFSGFGVALIPNEEEVKQAIVIKKFEKTEATRIIRESIEKRKKADNKLIIAEEDNRYKIKEEVKANFEKLPKYKEVMYATSKDSGFLMKRKHNWDEKSFLKFYTAQITEDGKLENEKKLPGDVNSKYHQSTPVLTKDGMTMYFTRLMPYKESKNRKSEKNGIGQLRIFQAQKVKGKWANIRELPYPINMSGSSSGHPTLSPKDDLLYFVSNRNKTITDSDLYVVSIKKSGGFANIVESLGDEINTYGRETFPFIDNNGVLYFSSDGHPGLGGLDVFAAVKDDNGKYVVLNVGEPINSVSDDFSYVIDGDSKKGFLSSNRVSSKEDKVYNFLELQPVIFPFKISPVYYGTVKDSMNGAALAGVELKIYNELNEKIHTITTDESGKYTIELPPLKDYHFVFKKNGFADERLLVKGLKNSEKKEVSVALFNELAIIVDDKVITIKDGDDLTKTLKLSPIYFDYGGYTIRKSSKLELDKVINLIKKRPSISVVVRSHTDSRGKSDYNLKLSKNRAKTTMDYIVIEGGISRDRVWGDGYGEAELINKCSDGVKCSEAEHELNRRSEFIVVIKQITE